MASPPILFPPEPLPGELPIDPSTESPLPFPSTGWDRPPSTQGPDESENFGVGTWLMLGAFAAVGAIAYRHRNSFKKALP